MNLESKLRFDPGIALQGRVVRANTPIAQTAAFERVAATLAAGSRSQAKLVLPLSPGAVVDEARITVTAEPAGWQVVGNSAETRAAAGTADSAAQSLIIDFQSLRTVSALKPPRNTALSSIQAWLGTAFVEQPIWQAESATVGATATFEEAQTERLLVTFSFAVDPRRLAELGEVHLPSPPGDLELSVGGRQVWSFRGPVRRDAEGWQRYSTTLDIADALQQSLAEGAGGSTASEVAVVLDARTPGVLSLNSQIETFEVHTVTFPEGTSRSVETTSEGVRSVALSLPEGATQWTLHELRFDLRGTPTHTRVLPPDGPAANADADLLLGPDRSMAIRIAADADSLLASLASVHGIRLFLEAEEESELHAQFHADAEGRPGEAVGGGTFDPLPLQRSDSGAWHTLSLPRPLTDLDKDLWLLVHISRGRAASPLGLGSPESSQDSSNALLIGLPTGPFRPLPAIPDLAPAGFQPLLRLVGEAPDQAPIPALQIRADPPRLAVQNPPKLAVGPATRPAASLRSDPVLSRLAGAGLPQAVELPSMITGDGTELRFAFDPPWTGAAELSLDFLAFAPADFQIENARVIYRRPRKTGRGSS